MATWSISVSSIHSSLPRSPCCRQPATADAYDAGQQRRCRPMTHAAPPDPEAVGGLVHEIGEREVERIRRRATATPLEQGWGEQHCDHPEAPPPAQPEQQRRWERELGGPTP